MCSFSPHFFQKFFKVCFKTMVFVDAIVIIVYLSINSFLSIIIFIPNGQSIIGFTLNTYTVLFNDFTSTFKVNKSRVRGLEKKVTKTHTSREVYLNERSTLALKYLIQFKKDQGYNSDYLMLCPKLRSFF